MAGAAGVVVLGAARSGTSAIARTLVSAGFFAGRNEDLLGPTGLNAVGHYELLAAIEVNERALQGFGCCSWREAPSPDEQAWYREQAKPHIEAVLDALLAQAGGAPIAVKDPRINGLLPLWQAAIEDSLHPLLTVRDPLEVALSDAAFFKTPLSAALAAWEVQMASALAWLDGREATIVPYSALVARPALAADLVRGVATRLDPARAGRLRPDDAAMALRPDLRRQRDPGHERDEHLTVRQAELWSYLSELPAGMNRLDVPPALRGPSRAAQAIVRHERERAESSESSREAIERAERRAAELERGFADATALARRAVEAAEGELAVARDEEGRRRPLRGLGRALSRRGRA